MLYSHNLCRRKRWISNFDLGNCNGLNCKSILRSEEAIIELILVSLGYLLIYGVLMPYLGLCLSEFDIGRTHIRILWLIKLVSIFELFFKDAQVRSSLLEGRDVFLGDLGLDFRGHH